MSHVQVNITFFSYRVRVQVLNPFTQLRTKLFMKDEHLYDISFYKILDRH